MKGLKENKKLPHFFRLNGTLNRNSIPKIIIMVLKQSIKDHKNFFVCFCLFKYNLFK